MIAPLSLEVGKEKVDAIFFNRLLFSINDQQICFRYFPGLTVCSENFSFGSRISQMHTMGFNSNSAISCDGSEVFKKCFYRYMNGPLLYIL